ncbi:MAG TPA: response regulator transcription factor [Bacteroidia bacterium]|nr:response regulator transcription factor [Bacteroidota bacterium]HRD37423.1 response regulator transcription factor [Bacteroidia bacterium]
MKKKRIETVTQDDFDSIYKKKIRDGKKNWREIFKSEIDGFNSFITSDSFWYIGDFATSKIVMAGGELEVATPLHKNEWVGISPMEIGKMFHPLDVAKMQAFTVFISDYFARRTQKEINNVKVSMLFRMLNSKNEYTWRILSYPKIKYENNLPRYIFCLISDCSHLVNEPESTMFVFDNNDKESVLYFCNEETVELKRFHEKKPLTQRETEVVKLLAKGLISKEIAHLLGISKNTVENHKQNIFEKTKTKNIAELITYAIKNKLVD